MVNAKKLIGILCFLIGIVSYNHIGSAMEKKPYHHLPDGTFRNPEGSPKRDANFKWSYKIFNQEKKKLDMTVPKEHVIDKEKVLSDLRKYQEDDYVAWIGHATFLIKLGNTTIITDPVFSKNAGPLIFGPKRFTEPALELNEIPKTDIFLLYPNDGFKQKGGGGGYGSAGQYSAGGFGEAYGSASLAHLHGGSSGGSSGGTNGIATVRTTDSGGRKTQILAETPTNDVRLRLSGYADSPGSMAPWQTATLASGICRQPGWSPG